MNCGWPIRNACRHDSEPGPQRSASVAAFEFVPLLGRIGCRLSPSQFLARHRDHGIRQLNRTLIFLTVQCLLSRLKLRSDGRDIGLISRSIKTFRLTQFALRVQDFLSRLFSQPDVFLRHVFGSGKFMPHGLQGFHNPGPGNPAASGCLDLFLESHPRRYQSPSPVPVTLAGSSHPRRC